MSDTAFQAAIQGELPLSGSSAPSARPPGPLGSLVGPEGLALARGVLDAHQIKFAYLYDKLRCLSNSRTRLLPHQIEATHRIATALHPRFILADEVGLGKTIEAGLAMKELVLRRGYSRILIVVPAPLTVQWQQEMHSKFNEDFTIVNRANFLQIASNWQRHPRIITSVDFIKNERYADRTLQCRWDLAIFDEAHRLRRDYNKVTRAYAFAEKVANKTEALLLLTATPFRGKIEELFYLVQLVDPHLLGPHVTFFQDYIAPSQDKAIPEGKMNDLKERVGRVMLRRRKVDVGGFTRRFARTIRFELSPDERAFYDETTEYVRREYNLAMKAQNRAVSFIMIVFQKLLDSSTRALLRALEKRKAHLEQKIFSPTLDRALKKQGDDIIHEQIDFDECDEPEDFLEDLDRQDGVSLSLKDLRREIMTLAYLIRIGRRIQSDRKLHKLQEVLRRLKKEGRKKFIIFTQFRTTQDYLHENLTPEFRVTLFHGSLSLQAKEDAITEFKHETEILICTEAGGEGRNLQFANILFNYDLPWSPLKIEQRIGRIHRFGQEYDVYIFNFATRDTVSERVLEVLQQKIKLFEETIGTPDILLGSLEDEGTFSKTLMNFLSGRKTKAELDAEMDARIELSERGYRKLNDLITPQALDFNLNDYHEYMQTSRKVENHQVEKLTLQYIAIESDSEFQLTKTVRPAKRGEPLLSGDDSSPYVLSRSNSRTTRPATFDSEAALAHDEWEFLATGHPLVNAALDYFMSHPQRKSILHVSKLGPWLSGKVFVYIIDYGQSIFRRELIGIHLGPDGKAFVVGGDEELASSLQSAHVSSVPHRIDDEELFTHEQHAQHLLTRHATGKAEAISGELHSLFKKEEYKLEVSFGKKIRQLEERLDRQKLKARQKPGKSSRAQLTRSENELMKARHEREQRLHKIRKESAPTPRLELLMVIAINNGP